MVRRGLLFQMLAMGCLAFTTQQCPDILSVCDKIDIRVYFKINEEIALLNSKLGNLFCWFVVVWFIEGTLGGNLLGLYIYITLP